MKNIHLLTTDKPSRLILQGTELLLSKYMEVNEGFSEFNQYLYITNDEEIKVGDWCIYHSGEVIQYLVKVNTDNLKKIILTTDQDLIADGIQAIDDEFLEWFVKNPTCEFVAIKNHMICDNCGQPDCDNLRCRGHKDSVFYEIILPQTSKYVGECQEKNEGCFLDSPGHNCGCFVKVLKEEPTIITDWLDEHGDPEIYKKVEKQLELEEAAEEFIRNDASEEARIAIPLLVNKCVEHFSHIFIAGAKWQQERMYSEEDLRDAWKEGNTPKHKCLANGLDKICSCANAVHCSHKERVDFEDWFQQFKKK